MDILTHYKETIMQFLCSPAFIGATALFLIYLVVWKVIRGIWGLFIGIIFGVLGLLNPMRFRRFAINTLSLIFMTASFALCAGANAKLHYREAMLESILGGSLAVAVWATIMFVVNIIRGEPKKKPKYRRSPPDYSKFRPKSSKIVPPSALDSNRSGFGLLSGRDQITTRREKC